MNVKLVCLLTNFVNHFGLFLWCKATIDVIDVGVTTETVVDIVLRFWGNEVAVHEIYFISIKFC